MSIQYVFVVLNLYVGNLNKTEKAYITKVANFFCDAIKRQSCHHIETIDWFLYDGNFGV